MKHCILTGLLLLTACNLAHPEREAQYWTSPKKIGVVPRQASHTVYFSAGSDALAPQERQALKRFLAESGAKGFGSVTIYTGEDSSRRLALRRALRAAGFAGNDIAVMEPLPDQSPDSALVDVSYATVELPPCPDWSSSAIVDNENGLHSNTGCAQARNVGAMIADPRDLLKGRGEVRPDSGRNDLVIENYRAGTAAESSNTSSQGSDSGSASGSAIGAAVSAASSYGGSGSTGQ